MIHLLHTGAVPFGYVSGVTDIYVSCSSDEEECLPPVMNLRHSLHGTESCQHLPDIVLSSAPPHSSPPGRRHVCRCRCAHPRKPRTHTTPPPPPRPHSQPRDTPAAPSIDPTEEESAKFELPEGHETLVAAQSYLPEVWSVSPPQARGSPGVLLTHPEMPGMGLRRVQQQWRFIGCDLRKVADHFQLNTSKKWRKNKVTPSLVVPASVCRCVVASLVCLAWWRLYNKLY